MDTRAAARRWAETWRSSWESQQLEPILALYAPDAALFTTPMRPPYRGHDGVRDYVSQAFAEEAEVHAWFGAPVVDGSRAAVEWWATLLENGQPTTIAGTSVLEFDADGRVVRQHDAWEQMDGRRRPPPEWER